MSPAAFTNGEVRPEHYTALERVGAHAFALDSECLHRGGGTSCGTQPPRGFGPFALQHAPPAPGQAQGGLQPRPASAGLGQLAALFRLASHTGLVFDIGGTPRCAEWTATCTLQLASTRGWAALAHDGRCEPSELARTIPVLS